MATDSTLISVIMSSLQVIGLFLPVIVLTTRFVIRGLEPSGNTSPAEAREVRDRQKRLALTSVVLIFVLSMGAVILIIAILRLFDLPFLVVGGLGALIAGFLLFGFVLIDAVLGTDKIL